MTQPPAPSRAPSIFADGRGMAMLIYALLFFMPMTVGPTGILALLLATFSDSDKTPEWIKSHYQFQVRTFWIGILPTLATFFIGQYLLKAQAIEPVYMFAVVIPVLGWVAARCAMGFNHLLYGRPYPNPKSWLV